MGLPITKGRLLQWPDNLELMGKQILKPSSRPLVDMHYGEHGQRQHQK